MHTGQFMKIHIKHYFTVCCMVFSQNMVSSELLLLANEEKEIS